MGDSLKATVSPLLSAEEKNGKLNSCEKVDLKPVKARKWPQVYSTLSADMCSYLNGSSAGYVGIYLPDMRDDPYVMANLEQSSWIVSAPCLTTMLGGILAAWLAEKTGRLMTMKITMVVHIVGWLVWGFAYSYPAVIIGISLVGLANGIGGAVKQVYISEISHKSMRGVLASSTSTVNNFGMLLCYIIALGIDWRTSAFLHAALAAASLLSYFLIIKSPFWLIKKGRQEKARKALVKVRGDNYDVDSELQEIIKKQLQNQEENEAAHGHWKQKLALIFSLQTMKAFGILFLIFFVQRFSGAPVLTSYTKDIFQEASNGEINIHWAIIVSGVVRLALTLIGNVLIKYVNRKIIFGVSGLGMAASLCGLATYNYLNQKHNIGYPWTPAICIYLFIAFMVPGFVTLTGVFIGELFPLRTRGSMSSILTCLSAIMYFISIKTYPGLVSIMDVYGVFWLFSAVALLGSMVLVIVLPDTEGKTLIEIEDGLVKEKKNVEKNLVV